MSIEPLPTLEIHHIRSPLSLRFQNLLQFPRLGLAPTNLARLLPEATQMPRPGVTEDGDDAATAGHGLRGFGCRDAVDCAAGADEQAFSVDTKGGGLDGSP